MDKSNNQIKMSISTGKPITGKYCDKMNLGNLLIDAAENQKQHGIIFIQNDDSEVFLSYEELLERALFCLGALEQNNLSQGSFAILSFENNMNFIVSFWACILGGIIPVPISYPSSFKGKNSSLEKLINVWNTLEKPVIICDERMIDGVRSSDQYSDFKNMTMLDIKDLSLNLSKKGLINLSPSDTPAFIQFSSGSTNTPKGVILTHLNLLTNIEGIIEGSKLTSKDSMLSWMPYYHDMGLIGTHLTTLALGMLQINMHPFKFVKKPTLWFDLVSKHKVTLTASPNFGYRLLLKRATNKHLESWDLSSLRLIFNGAEPISVPLIKEFMEKLSVCKLSDTSMFTVYGMAEACLAVAFPPPITKPQSRSISRNSLINSSKINEISVDNIDSFQVADEGYAVPGIEIRIVNKDGNIVPEKELGEIQIRGNNVTSGYINNPQATNEVFQDGWLRTGDTGFMIDGRLCVTGRIKDIIFANGQNFFAHDIEFTLEKLEGVEAGKVVICSWHDDKEDKEKVALFSALHVKKDTVKSFYMNIITKVNEAFGISIDYIVQVKSIPKTTSGKIQRFVLIQEFLNNKCAEKTLTSQELFAESVDTVENMKMTMPKIEGRYCDKIRSIWAKVLEKPTSIIPLDQSFLSLGGNSLKAVEVLSMLEDELNLNLSHDILIKCHTINDMDEYIQNLCKSSLYKEISTENITQTDKAASSKYYDEDIAVISMACRFPDASTPEEFWENLKMGKCSIHDVPEDRWNIDEYYSSSADSTKTNCRKGAFLDKPFDFDAEFFNISEEEAAIMDPQQRLMLELVFEILERTGYSKQKISGEKLGLFIGASTNSYYEYHLNTLNMKNLARFQSFAALTKYQQDSILEEWKSKFGVTDIHPNLLVDNILNMIAARTSQEFNLKGPSIVVDTACSSSIVTIHLACEALRRGECQIALAGGINLLLTPTPYIYFSNAGALSPSGESKVFDADANGFVPGEGAGLVMLKPLKKAMIDKDEILAVIRASAINNDGHSIGVMAPNPDGQREVIEKVYLQSGINPRDIQYVEAHGTGTKIGDPSEVRALDNAFSSWKPENNSMAIGSVKANIGHLLSAAGIASFIKVVMALNHKIMPPNTNLTNVNPSIKLNKTPFYTIAEAKQWQCPTNTVRRASINSFGFGGTNCHMIVEEAPKVVNIVEENSYKRSNYILCLSAHNKSSLEQKLIDMKHYLETNFDVNLGDLCYTENVLRTVFKQRCSIVAKSHEDLLNKLTLKEDISKTQSKIALMFTGQGSQYMGMGKELYFNLSIFKKYVDECSEAFYPYLKRNLTDLIYKDEGDEKLLAQTNITQPVVFTMDYAFGRLLIDLGVKPAYLLGHSVGEWAAACVAGAVTLKDAARIVAVRGKLMNDIQSSGSMYAVFTSRDKLEDLLKSFDGKVWIGAYNVTHQVISGEESDLERFGQLLLKEAIGFKKLKVSQAFHSPLMKPMLDAFSQVLAGINFHMPQIPIVSNISGELVEKELNTEYWLHHILSSVKFEQSLRYLSDKGVNTFIECGPDKILTGMTSGVITSNPKTVLPVLDRKKDCWETLLNTLGILFTAGINIDWSVFESGINYNKLSLPGYPFQRKTFMPDFGESRLKAPDHWFHKWNWEISNETIQKPLSPGAIIVFDDGAGIGEALSSILNTTKNKIYFVQTGSEYNYDNDKNFIINPAVENDYAQLVKSIKERISAVIHLWNLKRDKLDDKFINNKEVYSEELYSLLFTVRALREIDTTDFRLLVVTNKAMDISQELNVENPLQSSSVTLALALDQENTFMTSYCIDINKNEYNTNSALAALLIEELTKEVNGEGIVAVRNGIRYIREIKQSSPLRNSSAITFKDGETYLITGGTSDVGGKIAKAIAERAKVNLVLTGTKILPDRTQWSEEIENNSYYAKKIELILSLEKLGVKVAYEAVDVTDRKEMETLISRINTTYGSIHGVIHAAGTWDSSTFKLLDKSIATIEGILSPKVSGTIITDAVTRKEPLKFFLMLSSVSAIKKIWSSGLSDYAAANSFLTSYSIYRQREEAPGKTICLNYSLWSNTGMGSSFGDMSLLAIKAYGLNALSADKAANALMRVLSDGTQSVVHILDRVEQEQEKKVAATELKAVDFKTSKSIRETVYQVIAEQLGTSVEDLDTGLNFLDLGLDSLGAVKAMEKLGSKLNLELYPTLIFEYQTPDALIKYIENTYSSRDNEAAVDTSQFLSSTNPLAAREVKDIAIIGMSVKIPGANTLEEYWNNLVSGKCLIKEAPSDRWSISDYYNTDNNSLHTTYSKYGGFIDKPYDFDPLFFGMSPSEAQVIDPQQRIFLQVAWEALQQSGYGGRYHTNKIGVFVGCEQNNYMEHFTSYRSYMTLKNRLSNSAVLTNLSDEARKEIMSTIIDVLQPARMVPDAVAGNSINEVAARVSHCLNLTGPSLSVNSACSSSLVALHLACESIKSGQSEMAIVGGVNLNLSPTPYIGLSRVTALSSTGICYPFDSKANGMVLSEGASVLILKPLDAALQDKDNIWAVIKGSAINNDGHSQGLTAPRPQGQAEAIRNAYLAAGINPETVSYIETHGTGTPLGDPIEIEGMTNAFRSFTSKKGFCGIGSVKSSIGHMLSASGITSLIKVALALKNRTIPHTINYKEPNPNIDFADSPFFIVSEQPIEFKNNESIPLRAGVNAFGFGGTNAHVVLEEAPVETIESQKISLNKPPFILQITGRNEKVVKNVAAALKAHVEKYDELNVSSICSSISCSQKELSFKTAAVIESKSHLMQILDSIKNGDLTDGLYRGRSNPNRETPVHLLLDDNFKIDMECIESLCSRFSSFNTAYKKCMELKGSNNRNIESISTFAVLYAFGVLLHSFGFKPRGIIAEGIGVIAAAVLTGIFSLEQGIEILDNSYSTDNNEAFQDNNTVCFAKCPILTSEGIIETLPSVVNNSDETIGSLNEFVNRNDVVIYLGNALNLKSKLFYDDKLFSWVNADISSKPVEAIMKALAKIYTLGARYDISSIFEYKEGKVVLPTYPFENECYKVTFHEESSVSNKDKLLKLDKTYTLEESEKKSTYKTLTKTLSRMLR